MPLLNEDQKKEMALAHRKMYAAQCDECEKLIPAGQLYVVLKYTKVKWEGPPTQRPHTWNARVPKKVRCLECNNKIIEPLKPKQVIGGKGKKALTKDEAGKLNKMVRSIAIRMLKKSEKPIENASFKLKVFLKAKKKEPKIKKSVVNATIRLLKKAKVLKYKQKHWSLTEVKK